MRSYRPIGHEIVNGTSKEPGFGSVPAAEERWQRFGHIGAEDRCEDSLRIGP